VYTAAQAMRGETVYKEKCVTCHLEGLDGGGMAPSLVGDDFMADWQGKSVGDLFQKTNLTMPADDPGKLTPQETADSLAYILSKNKFPAGPNELAADAAALKQIRIQSPK
jgi:mono/diheme cytochrome c family protein